MKVREQMARGRRVRGLPGPDSAVAGMLRNEALLGNPREGA